MNFLAHAYLSLNDPELIVGNIIGDFVKGKSSLERYGVGIKKGIILHRKIDSFTDSHPLVTKSKNIFPTKQRRYASIVLDMLYDHFLARNWIRYSEIELSSFTSNVYHIISKYEQQFPPGFEGVFRHMRENDWLASYQEFENIQYALHRISFRLKNSFDLENLLLSVDSKLTLLEHDFLIFFENLREYVWSETL